VDLTDRHASLTLIRVTAWILPRSPPPPPPTLSVDHHSFLSRFFAPLLALPTAASSTIIVKRKVAAEELLTQAEPNSYRMELTERKMERLGTTYFEHCVAAPPTSTSHCSLGVVQGTRKLSNGGTKTVFRRLGRDKLKGSAGLVPGGKWVARWQTRTSTPI
jgi:hypothetical protein